MSSKASALNVDKSSPVLVTGATGYIAGVLIQQLIDLGVTVHAAVRDPSKTDRLHHLIQLTDSKNSQKGSIKFFAADLTQPGSYAEAMRGCSIVFHTASPFVLKVEDPVKDLVEPAVEGTRNVLRQASLTPSVKRVIVTSSVAAIYGDLSDNDQQQHEKGRLTEEMWNRTSSVHHQPYAFSKVLAEQTAWVMAGSQKQWTLATVNPSFVMGPGVMYHASSESYSFMQSMGDGAMATGCPHFGIGVVDVRDVAQAHILAAYREDASGRYICSGHNSNFLKMAAALRPKYADYPLPTRAVPKAVLWLVGPYVGLTRRFVSNNINYDIHLDNSKSKKELEMEYRPLEVTVQEMFQQMIEVGAVTKKK